MTDQLVLIDSHRAWRMDSPTRELGLRGVARAREALQRARTRTDESEPDPECDRGDRDVLASAA